MKINLTCVLLFLVLLACSPAQTQQSPEQLAHQAAGSWLILIDSGKYADSWQEASSFFKSHVSKEQWRSMLRASRDPFGKLTSRKFKSASYTRTLPGTPDGEYVVIQYESSFENKQSSVETITPMLDKDGRWRIAGYYIK